MNSSYRLFKTIEDVNASVNALAFDSDTRYLASATNDGYLHVYDIGFNCSTLWEVKGSSSFTALVWMDASTLMAGNMEGAVMLFKPSRVSGLWSCYVFLSPIHFSFGTRTHGHLYTSSPIR